MTPRASPDPSLPLSIRAYARHRRALGLPGGDESTVRRAVKIGRLPRELLTPGGKVIDPDAADRSWEANGTGSTYVPQSGPTAPKRPPPDSRPVICVEDQAVALRYPLGPFLAGAAAALRAAGRKVTPEALGAAVEAVDVTWWWALIVRDVTGRTDAAVPLADLQAAWERAGRDAATEPEEDG